MEVFKKRWDNSNCQQILIDTFSYKNVHKVTAEVFSAVEIVNVIALLFSALQNDKLPISIIFKFQIYEVYSWSLNSVQKLECLKGYLSWCQESTYLVGYGNVKPVWIKKNFGKEQKQWPLHLRPIHFGNLLQHLLYLGWWYSNNFESFWVKLPQQDLYDSDIQMLL